MPSNRFITWFGMGNQELLSKRVMKMSPKTMLTTGLLNLGKSLVSGANRKEHQSSYIGLPRLKMNKYIHLTINN